MSSIITRLNKAEEHFRISGLNEQAQIDAMMKFYATGKFPEGIEFPDPYACDGRFAAIVVKAHSRYKNEIQEKASQKAPL